MAGEFQSDFSAPVRARTVVAVPTVPWLERPPVAPQSLSSCCASVPPQLVVAALSVGLLCLEAAACSVGCGAAAVLARLAWQGAACL